MRTGSRSIHPWYSPALYAYGWALSELWRSWNVEPRVVLGHSLGEYVAATVAGVMTPEEGIRLVAARGRLTEGADRGRCHDRSRRVEAAGRGAYSSLCLSRVNLASLRSTARRSVVVSGRREAVEQFEEQLRGLKVRHRRLRTTHGFHSQILDGMLDAFQSEASAIAFRVPEVSGSPT